MTVVSTDKDLAPIYFPAKDLLRRVGKDLIELITKIEFPKNKASSWPLIFLQSAANGCCYRGEDLPHSKWQWPKDTWFQEQRRRQLMSDRIERGTTRCSAIGHLARPDKANAGRLAGVIHRCRSRRGLEAESRRKPLAVGG